MIEKEDTYVTRWANAKPIYIHEVDATDSAIGYDGFKFFRECRELRVLKLNYCEYFDDEAFRHLAYGRPKNTLNELEIITNGSVSEGIIKWITELKALKRLHLYLLPRIRNRNAFIRQVQLALPQCNITFPESDKFGYGYNVKQYIFSSSLMDDKERSEKIYNTWKNRVFRVEGGKLNGSGIALGRKHLLTAAHMGFKLKERYSLHGTNDVHLSATVEYINRKADVALLKSDELPDTEIERRNLDVGRNYFLMGYPSDVVESAPSISKGIVENFHADQIHLVGSPGARYGYSGKSDEDSM
uniref:Mitochondrial ATP synthase regulatory component factor B n=1 Tax=Acrobeloides nanus TaxID=290746 RepID=A0A914EJH5_9BILA